MNILNILHSKYHSSSFSLFNFLVIALLILLPFNVILSVFFQFKLGVDKFEIYKEVLILLIFFSLVYEFFKNKKFPIFSIIDYLIFGYIFYLILISFVHFAGFKALIYGGRYDFEFLFVFLIFRHGFQFLKENISYYIRVFLISGAVALLLGILVRFVFGETILLNLGFSARLSSWNFGESIPIYHGIEGANIKRFQGIFDGPNQTAFFLIVYLGLIIHYLKSKKNMGIYALLILFFILGLLLLTYSRSSIVGLFIAIFVVVIINIKIIFKKYKIESIIALILFTFLGGIFFIKYGGTIDNIILRLGSSKGHYERMIIGFNRFKQNPLGEGLASSGPAYRTVYDTKNTSEKFYIPESWYIQQLVEGGIIGLTLFLLIVGFILIKTYSVSIPMFASFLGVLVMNLFLHTFEAVYVSIILFLFLGMFLKAERGGNKFKRFLKYFTS